MLEERRQNQNQVAPSVCTVFIVPNTPQVEAVGMADNTDNAASGPKSLSSRVKAEPLASIGSSIVREEHGKGRLPMTCRLQLMVAAYEPSQELRDQIASLNASWSKGALIPLPVRWES